MRKQNRGVAVARSLVGSRRVDEVERLLEPAVEVRPAARTKPVDEGLHGVLVLHSCLQKTTAGVERIRISIELDDPKVVANGQGVDDVVRCGPLETDAAGDAHAAARVQNEDDVLWARGRRDVPGSLARVVIATRLAMTGGIYAKGAVVSAEIQLR